jgi:hypothetical protein
MTAAAALDKQIERYRHMTGEQRLAVAWELHELSCEIAREGSPDDTAFHVDRAMKFICRFTKDELNINIEQHIPSEYLQEVMSP